MKNKKLLTGSLVGLASISAVATPLITMVSCGNKAVDLEKYDEIYGVDKFVYNTLELDFKNKINDAIEKDEKLSETEKERAKARTIQAAEIFRQQLNKLVKDVNSKDVAYTTVTNSMIDYAEN
ncbi:MAG: hypothetical protein MJ200_05880, partial [Mycoplasmoidaceae bacterium]|nr:hypothetical protein [Mycoplasmoidaceae bacterium]